MKFYKNLLIIMVTLAKLAFVIALFGIALALILAPSFALALNVHWAIGVVYGIIAFVLIVTGAITLLQGAKSQRPVGDWLEQDPFSNV